VRLEATVAGSHLCVLSIDASKLSSLAVGKIVHSGLGEVESSSGVVDGQDVDSLSVVCDSVACAALGGVPASNTLVASNARERRDVDLLVPAVLGDETVRSV
jgi:hypothetical protein